jgi:hypothetical protein
MKLQDIKAKIKAGSFKFSLHAEIEAEADNLAISQVVESVVNGKILEDYPDTGRGASCLIVGLAGNVQYAVCVARMSLSLQSTFQVLQSLLTLGNEVKHDN